MPFEFRKTELEDVMLVIPKVFEDDRGFFLEGYKKSDFINAGITYDFNQDNHSKSSFGVLRGLHYQTKPKMQAKLVRCTKGAVLDVAVDIRKGSPTYKKWVAVELSAENKRQLMIPRGFAHGFVTLTDEVEFLYKADNLYCFESEGSIRWDDPQIGVNWGIESPIVSDKDATAPLFDDNKFEYFTYEVKK